VRNRKRFHSLFHFFPIANFLSHNPFLCKLLEPPEFVVPTALSRRSLVKRRLVRSLAASGLLAAARTGHLFLGRCLFSDLLGGRFLGNLFRYLLGHCCSSFKGSRLGRAWQLQIIEVFIESATEIILTGFCTPSPTSNRMFFLGEVSSCLVCS